MKRRHSIITGAALLAAVALTGAPALAAGDNSPGMMQKSKDTVKETAREAKTEVTDSWVTSRAKIALFSDSRVKGRQITVETMKGVVTLRGKVDSDDAKTAAGEVVKGVDHVKGVKNDLQVVKPKERRSVDISDKDITARVEKRLTQDSGLKKITARTDAGVVTLTGEAPSLTASARASEMAREVSGVQSVKNEVQVQSKQVHSKMSRHGSDNTSRLHSKRATEPALSSEEMKAVQDSLKRQGYDPGPADGVMGPRTAAALRGYQKDHGLQMTSRADSETMARLGVEGAMLSQKQSP